MVADACHSKARARSLTLDPRSPPLGVPPCASAGIPSLAAATGTWLRAEAGRWGGRGALRAMAKVPRSIDGATAKRAHGCDGFRPGTPSVYRLLFLDRPSWSTQAERAPEPHQLAGRERARARATLGLSAARLALTTSGPIRSRCASESCRSCVPRAAAPGRHLDVVKAMRLVSCCWLLLLGLPDRVKGGGG